MGGDVARGQRSPQAGRVERRLAIQRAHAGAFVVAEHRRIHGAGDVVVGEFQRRAHVDDFVEIIQSVQAGEQVFQGEAIQWGMANSRMLRLAAPCSVPADDAQGAVRGQGRLRAERQRVGQVAHGLLAACLHGVVAGLQAVKRGQVEQARGQAQDRACLLYTSDAADE